MNKASLSQKVRSKQMLVKNLNEQLINLKLQHHEEIKNFEAKQYILKHLIHDAELYGKISSNKFFGFDVRNCYWCETSFFDSSKSKNQKFCRDACKAANFRNTGDRR